MKARPGVCDSCGHAVVRMNESPPKNGTVDGHTYREGKLVEVLCYSCGGNPEADASGGRPPPLPSYYD